VRTSLQDNNGFTLVEMLVALVLVSLLATSLALASNQLGALLRAERKTTQKLNILQAVRHITHLIEQVEDIPILTFTDREPIRSSIYGNSDSMRFVAVARRGAVRQGLREVTIQLEKGPSGKLVQLMIPRRVKLGPQPEVDRIELAEDIKSLSFLYYGMQGEDQSPAWHDNWRDMGNLPLVISVKVKSRGTDFDIEEADSAIITR
jgi:prepilin-type N-terminal cleavage/methylation domain-containing protein